MNVRFWTATLSRPANSGAPILFSQWVKVATEWKRNGNGRYPYESSKKEDSAETAKEYVAAARKPDQRIQLVTATGRHAGRAGAEATDQGSLLKRDSW